MERPRSTPTKTTLTVQGVYSNREMEERIEGVWDQLTALISETLNSLVQAAPVSSKAEAGSAVPPQLIVTDATPMSPVSAIHAGAPAEPLDRTSKLWQRMDQLFDALMEGRIKEATYEKLRAQIEQELQALQ